MSLSRNTNSVWATGACLIAFTIGVFCGHSFGDKSPHPTPFVFSDPTNYFYSTNGPTLEEQREMALKDYTFNVDERGFYSLVESRTGYASPHEFGGLTGAVQRAREMVEMEYPKPLTQIKGHWSGTNFVEDKPVDHTNEVWVTNVVIELYGVITNTNQEPFYIRK